MEALLVFCPDAHQKSDVEGDERNDHSQIPSSCFEKGDTISIHIRDRHSEHQLSKGGLKRGGLQ